MITPRYSQVCLPPLIAEVTLSPTTSGFITDAAEVTLVYAIYVRQREAEPPPAARR